MAKLIPHGYQRHAVKWLIDKTICSPQRAGGLFLDPGLGKTSITLFWLKSLSRLGYKRALIVAPLRVIYNVWPNEVAKWSQFKGFRVSIIHGSEAKRKKALNAEADLYLINTDGVAWLSTQMFKPFDALVVDESSQFKTWSSQRSKALRKIVKQSLFKVILTGTPSPNTIEDLYPQSWILDQGKALGKNVTQFRNVYMQQGGYTGYEWSPKPGAKEAIEEKLNPLVLRLAEEDHLQLPPTVTNDIWVDLPTEALKQYKKLEREMFTELDKDSSIVAVNAGSKYNLCKQFANGGIYLKNEDGKTRISKNVHSAKVTALKELIDELQGKPLLVAFQYGHDLSQIKWSIPEFRSIDGSTNPSETTQLIDLWNAGALPLLAVQPQALSHGINMQAGPGRDVCWFGLTDNLETYLQFNKRIHRQGVTGQVRFHRILARKTVDLVTLANLENKDTSQKSLLEALKSYRNES